MRSSTQCVYVFVCADCFAAKLLHIQRRTLLCELSPRYFLHLSAHQGSHATTRFLEGFLEGSLKEMHLRRVLRRRLVRVSVGTEALRTALRRGVS